MKFGIFYEHQIPRPWNEGDEHRLFKEALDQVELADRLGIDYVWEVEHHFLEEYSHSSAPEVFLAACSQRTTQIRLGHGIVLMPPGYNHPARVAERVATLDLVSDGRVDWGTGESSSRIELEGFGVDPQEKRDMWLESVRETARMMVSDPYPGYDGKYFSMPHRSVVPKPVQRPHPPPSGSRAPTERPSSSPLSSASAPLLSHSLTPKKPDTGSRSTTTLSSLSANRSALT